MHKVKSRGSWSTNNENERAQTTEGDPSQHNNNFREFEHELNRLQLPETETKASQVTLSYANQCAS